MWLFVLFVTVPIIEIALFIQIGGEIGLLSTLCIVIATAFLGTYLVRKQGLSALSQLKNNVETLENPIAPLAHGIMILLAGALLLTPGFFTDAVGFSLWYQTSGFGYLNALSSASYIRKMGFHSPMHAQGARSTALKMANAMPLEPRSKGFMKSLPLKMIRNPTTTQCAIEATAANC